MRYDVQVKRRGQWAVATTLNAPHPSAALATYRRTTGKGGEMRALLSATGNVKVDARIGIETPLTCPASYEPKAYGKGNRLVKDAPTASKSWMAMSESELRDLALSLHTAYKQPYDSDKGEIAPYRLALAAVCMTDEIGRRLMLFGPASVMRTVYRYN